MAWLEHGGAKASSPNQLVQLLYGLGKGFQLAFPLLFLKFTIGEIPRPGRPNTRGLRLGVAFGGLVSLGTIALYFVFLRDTSVFQETPQKIGRWLTQFALNSPAGFALVAVGISIPHSLLEEYYWRLFVFGELRRRIPMPAAMAISSIAFGAFHIFQLNAFLPGHFFTAVLPFTACVAVGGAFWAWLYDRTGSVYAPWVSHFLVDASLFVIGYDLYFVRGYSS